MKYLGTIILLLFVCSLSNAQTPYERAAQEKCKQKVWQLNDYISKIADKSRSNSTRLIFKKNALKLFISEGNEYTEFFTNTRNGREDSIVHQGVVMEVSSLSRGTVKPLLMKTYFHNLLNLKYQAVHVISTNAGDMKVTNLRLIRTDGDIKEYQCTVFFAQVFSVTVDGKIIPIDKTYKKVKCYLTVDVSENEMITRLGDVTVDKTEFPKDVNDTSVK